MSTRSSNKKTPMVRTISSKGFHTKYGERFWSRPLYGVNRRSFVATGELPHAAFLKHIPTRDLYEGNPDAEVFVRCGQFLPGIISKKGTRWLYQAEELTASYDPGMMRFVIKDPTIDGVLQMKLVPLTPGDGYVVRITTTDAVELAVAFGGFLHDIGDNYQGNSDAPGGIESKLYHNICYSTPMDGVSLASVENIHNANGKALGQGLKSALISDCPTLTSLHETQTGIALDELLRQEPGKSSVQVHRIDLEPGQSVNFIIATPTQDNFEDELRELSKDIAGVFDRSKERVNTISRRINLQTPDTLVDLGARSLSVSMDGLWSAPVFMHGPVRWAFTGLMGWRMGYGADVCGNYDRTASHIKYYGEQSNKGGLDRSPQADPKTLLSKQALDSIYFSEGGIVNWDNYNMTEMWLHFINHHYQWTGDREFLCSMWPAIRDAVAFQKRVLDMDGDSLYQNYANYYNSDGHWHAGGNCTQASAYTYLGNLLAAKAADLVGESSEPYLNEAENIHKAMNNTLWLKEKGVFAEWKDTLGEKLLHPDPELGAIHLPINCGVSDEFQTYQMLRFTEWGLPNNIIEENGQQVFDEYYSEGSTYAFPQAMKAREVKSSNWKPMVLTVSESTPGEQMDTALAYYKLGLVDRAFPLVKAVLRCMVNMTATGGLVIRDQNTEIPAKSWGNRDIDHCDTIGPSLACLAEGIFGIHPNMADNFVEIQPGFPSDWNHAKIELRDIEYTFKRQGNIDIYSISTSNPTVKRLRLVLRGDGALVKVNGNTVAEPRVVPAICHPFVEVESTKDNSVEFTVTHASEPLPSLTHAPATGRGVSFEAICHGGTIVELNDPQGIFSDAKINADNFTANVSGSLGHHTAFLRMKGKNVEFWQPVDVEVREAIDIIDAKLSDDTQVLQLSLRNNGGQMRHIEGKISFAGETIPVNLDIQASKQSQIISLPLNDTSSLVPGLNRVILMVEDKVVAETQVECWDLLSRTPQRKIQFNFKAVDISVHFNDNLALVHTHEYLTPRTPYVALQIPSDLFREWSSYWTEECGKLDMSNLEKALTGNDGLLMTDPGIPFRTDVKDKNIVFVSQWDNFPTQIKIPVGQAAGHAYLLMASVTNPMQSGLANGRVVLNMAGGQKQTLELFNPDNLSWCVTHYPNRYGPLNLVKPAVKLGEHLYATIYSIPLPETGVIESLSLEAITNESVIGLMGLTLCPT